MPKPSRTSPRRVEDAIRHGARIAARAAIPTGTDGYFFAPTLLADVPADADIVRQDTFGPVASIVTWRDRDELLTLVNDSETGLAAYVFAGNLQYATYPIAHTAGQGSRVGARTSRRTGAGATRE